MVSGCYHIATKELSTEKECQDWVCSLQGNAINFRTGECNAKRCDDEDPQLNNFAARFDVYFRI